MMILEWDWFKSYFYINIYLPVLLKYLGLQENVLEDHFV